MRMQTGHEMWCDVMWCGGMGFSLFLRSYVQYNGAGVVKGLNTLYRYLHMYSTVQYLREVRHPYCSVHLHARTSRWWITELINSFQSYLCLSTKYLVPIRLGVSRERESNCPIQRTPSHPKFKSKADGLHRTMIHTNTTVLKMKMEVQKIKSISQESRKQGKEEQFQVFILSWIIVTVTHVPRFSNHMFHWLSSSKPRSKRMTKRLLRLLE